MTTVNLRSNLKDAFVFQGCGKSVIGREFAEMLGYSIEPVMLYQVRQPDAMQLNGASLSDDHVLNNVLVKCFFSCPHFNKCFMQSGSREFTAASVC